MKRPASWRTAHLTLSGCALCNHAGSRLDVRTARLGRIDIASSDDRGAFKAHYRTDPPGWPGRRYSPQDDSSLVLVGHRTSVLYGRALLVAPPIWIEKSS